MKYKPNSNLLTIADSPTQQHLVSLVIYLYIHRYIQMLLDSPPAPSSRLRSYVAMVLGASTTKEILLDYNPVRSDRFVSTLCKTDVATWRHKVSHVAEGRGNVLAGGERGKSHITYRPYGEILRTDSYGPDISKFKYTGQEEDRESGLMYYKARYYDAKIGRFLQQDSMAFPNQVNGMNRMMYVEGNPVSYRDMSGNSTNYSHMLNQIIKHAIIGAIKIATKTARSIGRGADYSMRKAGRGIDGAARQLVSGGKYSRNKGNDLDAGFSAIGIDTNGFFDSFVRGDGGTFLTKQYRDMRRKPHQRGELKQQEKDIQREEREFLKEFGVCAIGFGNGGLIPNTYAYDACISKVTYEHQSANIGILALYSSPFAPFGLGSVSTNTDPNCTDPSTGISTPNCPANNPDKSLRFWKNL